MFNTFYLILLCIIGFGWNVTFFGNVNRNQCGLVVFTGVFAKDLRILVGVVDLDDLPNVSLKCSDSFCFFKCSFISFSKIKPAVSERSPDLFFILRGVVRVVVVVVVGVDNGIIFLINGVADVDLGVCFGVTFL